MVWVYLWIGSALVFWTLALHPFLTYPLSLGLLARFSKRPSFVGGVATPAPTMAICTCAYNEAAVIQEKIENLLALQLRHPSLEILIYDDGSTDGTAERLEGYRDQISFHRSLLRRGKTAGMNRLVSASTAEIVVFSDANVRLDPQALENLAAHFVDPDVGCVCGHLTYTNTNASVTASTGSTYWRLEQFIKSQESRFGSVIGADGSLFAIRRNLHRSPPDDIIDDMYVSLQILCDGYKVIQVNDVRAYERSATLASEEFRRKVRIACQAFNVHRLTWPRLRRSLDPLQLYFYLSHKWMRWFAIYLIGVGYACFLVALILANSAAIALGVTAVIGALIWTGARWRVPVLSGISDIFGAFAGAGLGVWKSIRGARFQTWQPAASVRK